MKIKQLFGQEILDSRGNPTVAATMILEDGSRGQAQVPSGASTGKHEAHELRDDDAARYHGQGVLKAVDNINGKITLMILGREASDQAVIDQALIELDGTPDKSALGANAMLAVSLACARASAVSEKKELYQYLAKFNPRFDGSYQLPIPMMNISNGGQHANWATDIQEYMVLPLAAASFSEALRAGAEIYQSLKQVIKEAGYVTTVGDEGGFAPAVQANSEPFALISQAVKTAGYQFGAQIGLGIDAAASEFFQGDFYKLKKENQSYDAAGLAGFYEKLLADYPIVTVEDIFAEDDWAGFAAFTAKHGANLQIVGDDLYVTNIARIQEGLKQKATNSVLIKLNQIGTLTETIKAILLAQDNNLTAVISHRSGETTDDFIADLAVAFNTGQIKTGAPARSERLAKYNRLLEIERQLGPVATMAKWPF